eukprot:16452002-Heterocapsa_arctica.AAC.1
MKLMLVNYQLRRGNLQNIRSNRVSAWTGMSYALSVWNLNASVSPICNLDDTANLARNKTLSTKIME